MRFSSILNLLPLLALTSSAPVQKRALSADDESVLQLALFLEHLEFTLYTEGYDNYTDAQYTAEGFPEGFRENILVIAEVMLSALVCLSPAESIISTA
jgi:hypothetical protein